MQLGFYLVAVVHTLVHKKEEQKYNIYIYNIYVRKINTDDRTHKIESKT